MDSTIVFTVTELLILLGAYAGVLAGAVGFGVGQYFRRKTLDDLVKITERALDKLDDMSDEAKP